jgi:hypothetical protein
LTSATGGAAGFFSLDGEALPDSFVDEVLVVRGLVCFVGEGGLSVENTMLLGGYDFLEGEVWDPLLWIDNLLELPGLNGRTSDSFQSTV